LPEIHLQIHQRLKLKVLIKYNEKKKRKTGFTMYTFFGKSFFCRRQTARQTSYFYIKIGSGVSLVIIRSSQRKMD